MKNEIDENVIHMELRPGHKEELIKKTKKLISIWEEHISKLCTEGPEFAKEVSITEPGYVIRRI